MEDFVKKYKWMIVLAIVAIFLDVRAKELFFTILLVYGLFIKLLLSDFLKARTKRAISVIIWTVFLTIAVSMIYVNYYLPHGPSYPTGDIVCQNDDRGPCGEAYIEDTSKLNIPDWSKFLRRYGVGLLIGLAFAGIVSGKKDEQ